MQPLRLCLAAAMTTLAVLLSGCGGRPVQQPSPPEGDSRVVVGRPSAVGRDGAAGAPVDCSVEIENRSGSQLAVGIIACELLDAQGFPLGTGLTTVQNLPEGRSRQVRMVIWGVRHFASARAFVTSAQFS